MIDTVDLERYSRGRINSVHRQDSIRKGIVEVIQLDAEQCASKVYSDWKESRQSWYIHDAEMLIEHGLTVKICESNHCLEC
jgi:hypothetical protein